MFQSLSINYLDIITATLGLAYILLEYKASIWMWVVGAVMQLLGIVLYYQKGLYADCGMEFYYLAMTAYGWWRWTRPATKPLNKTGEKQSLESSNTNNEAVGQAGKDTKGAQVEDGSALITHIPYGIALRWGALFLGLWALIWWLLTTFTDSTVPVADAFTTALSLIGIWALAHKYLEQWLIWIAVDVVTCWLYFQKDIPFKASLYALYVIIAIAGYIRWRRQCLPRDLRDLRDLRG